MHRITLTIEKAAELAEAQELPELAEAVEEARKAAWDTVALTAVPDGLGGYNLSLSAPTGVMVAWMLPPYMQEQLALPGGEPAGDLHVTLAYLGEVSELEEDDRRKMIAVVAEVVSNFPTFRAVIGSTGTFPPEDGALTYPFWVGVQSPELERLHSDIVAALGVAGLGDKVQGFDTYTPHITIAYLPTGQEAPPVTFAPEMEYVHEVTICVGPQRIAVRLNDEGPAMGGGWSPMMKSADRQPDRFTLSPMYVPNQVDYHGDWTDPEELQKAVWSYSKAGDRRIRLQHNTDIVAGECVELMCWPYEVTVPLTKADGTTQDFTYAPGTPFMGIIWDEWAWELVQNGELNGLSIGGSATMIEADLGEDALGKARDA